MAFRPAAVIAISLAGVGCGGGQAEPPDASAGNPDARPALGDYDDPGDFVRTGCQPGTLAGFVPEAIIHGRVTFPDFAGTLAFRIDSATAGAIGSRAADRVIVSADDIFVHVTIDDGSTGGTPSSRTIDLCAEQDDGTLTGHYARCVGGECLIGDIDPAIIVRRLPEADAQGLTLLGEIGATWDPPALAVNVRVDTTAEVAYVARYGDGLRIASVADPAHPVDLGHVPVEYPDAGEIWNDVKLADGPGAARYALMASSVAGIVVVDVTAPAAPAIVAHFGTPPDGDVAINIHTLAIDGGKAYLGNLDRGLEIWDVADPSHPAKLGEWSIPTGFLHDLYVAGARAYLNYWDAGMQVVDVSDPAAPALLGTFANYGETSSHSSWVVQTAAGPVAMHGDEQFGAHLRVVDVDEASPNFMAQVGEWQTRPEVSIHNVMAFGTTAVIAHYQDGVRVLDLSDPTQPTPTAWFNTWPGYAPGYGESFFEGVVGVDVDPVTRRIYLADTHRGLIILHLD